MNSPVWELEGKLLHREYMSCWSEVTGRGNRFVWEDNTPLPKPTCTTWQVTRTWQWEVYWHELVCSDNLNAPNTQKKWSGARRPTGWCWCWSPPTIVPDAVLLVYDRLQRHASWKQSVTVIRHFFPARTFSNTLIDCLSHCINTPAARHKMQEL